MHVLCNWFRSLSTSTILFYMLSSLLFKLLLPVLQVEVSYTSLSNGRREKQDIKDDIIWFCSNPNLGLYFPLFTHNSTCLIIYANGCNVIISVVHYLFWPHNTEVSTQDCHFLHISSCCQVPVVQVWLYFVGELPVSSIIFLKNIFQSAAEESGK